VARKSVKGRVGTLAEVVLVAWVGVGSVAVENAGASAVHEGRARAGGRHSECRHSEVVSIDMVDTRDCDEGG
jgi:hypothetical protein